jgi:hypothetical protein
MSRRILFSVLAASAALIATQASADRECFENSCRLPKVAEVPARAAADANAKSDRRSHHKSDHATAKAPAAAVQPPATAQLTGTVSVTQWPTRARAAHRHTAHGGRVVVAVPGTIYPDGNVVPSYPYRQSDPSWQLCQVEEGKRRHRSYDCGPYSYHPYGVYGHRPNGTYGGYRSTPAYVLAPNAKIIAIEPAD